MPRITRCVAVLSLTLATVAVAAVPANANHTRRLQATMTGPAINRVVPRGVAQVEQAQAPIRLEVRVENVNLPNGTVLDAYIRGIFVGRFTLNQGKGRLNTTLQFMVSRVSDVMEVKVGTTTILSGAFQIP